MYPNELFLRLVKNPHLNAASTFINKHTAINAVKTNLKNNAKEIAVWLQSNPTVSKTFDFLHAHPIGNGIPQGKKNLISNLTSSRVVLKPDPTCKFGFKVISAFPIVL